MAKKHKLIWSQAAANDLQSIIQYIGFNDSFENARKIHNKIMARIEALAKYPKRCRIIPELREIGVTQFRELIVKPYRICFRINKNEVALVGVLDSRRDLEEVLFQRIIS